MKKRVRMFALASACACTMMFGTAQAAEVETAPQPQTQSEAGIEPRSEKIVWVYKTIAGELYRRMYNMTTGEYIGGWIWCGGAG